MDIWFLFCLFIIAVLYSSVGHGGASGYLALMVLFGIEHQIMKSSALTLNLFVAGISFYNFFKQGYFKFSVLFPFIIGSIPMAFIGGNMNVDAHTYKIILGIFLFIAVSRMFFSPKGEYETSKTPVFYIAVIIGAIVGFLSGLIGIGGGIILSPLLLLLKWSNLKETAGISAMFIFLNSTSGLLGLYFNQNFHLTTDIFIWALVGVTGGFIGGFFSSTKLSLNNLKYVLASVLLVASIKLLIF